MSAVKAKPTIDLDGHVSWFLKNRDDLFAEQLKVSAAELLSESGNSHLAIVSEDGKIYEQHQFLKIQNEKIQLNRPPNWQSHNSSFHLLLKNKGNIWNFFSPKNITTYQSFFLFNPPQKIFFLQRRRYKRVAAPAGTKAIFRGPEQEVDCAHIQNISEGGMLIGKNSGIEKYPIGTIINEILIAIPSKTKKGLKNVSRKIIPVISKGKIVRSLLNQERSISSYGLSFLLERENSRKEIRDLVTYLENVIAYPSLFQI